MRCNMISIKCKYPRALCDKIKYVTYNYRIRSDIGRSVHQGEKIGSGTRGRENHTLNYWVHKRHKADYSVDKIFNTQNSKAYFFWCHEHFLLRSKALYPLSYTYQCQSKFLWWFVEKRGLMQVFWSNDGGHFEVRCKHKWRKRL